jgi:hypothetical protein
LQKKQQYINSSIIHTVLALTAAYKANSLYAVLDDTLEPLKVTHQGGCVKGSLSYTNAETEMLLQLMEQCLPVGTQE